MKCFSFTLFFLLFQLAHASIIYVDIDANGANNGTSWANAYEDLQDALAAASAGDEIWVAEGIYKPTSGINQLVSFEIPDDIDLLGGFSGNETTSGQRDWNAHVTTLSGNIGNQSLDTDNSRILISKAGSISSRIDGFTLTKTYSTAGTYNSSALRLEEDATLEVEHCIFKSNYSYIGPVANTEGHLILRDCLIYQNTNEAGGIIKCNAANTLTEIQGCTITQNSKIESFAVLFGGYEDYVTGEVAHYIIHNTIIWNNDSNASSNQAYAEVYYSVVPNRNLYDVVSNCIYENPKFTDQAQNDFTLQFISPARNEGINSYASNSNDLNHQLRIFDGNVDIGCFENQISSVVYVDINANGLNNGTSWTNAYEDLQDALTASLEGQELWIANGIYKPTSGTNRDIAFVVDKNIKLYGGFAGNEINRSDRDWGVNETILSGAIGSLNDITDNSKVIIHFDNVNALIDGLHIRRAYGVENIGAFSAILALESEVDIRHCEIYDNTTRDYPALYLCNSDVELNNCLVRDNHSVGAISNETTTIALACSESSNLKVIETTIAQNTSDKPNPYVFGGFTADLYLEMYNSIVWDNSGQFANTDLNVEAEYNVIQSGFPGTNNLDLDPLFTNPSANDFSLQFLSPARNAGDVARNTLDLDLMHLERIFDGSVDMGAFESQDDGIIYVNDDASGLNDGSSWANAYTDLHDALSDATEGYEIWVAAGTYKPTTGTDRNIKFSIPQGVHLYGGFAGLETQRGQRDWNFFVSIISGAIGASGETDNSRNLFYALQADGIVIDGFDIRKAYNETTALGSAIIAINGNATVKHCVIHDNYSLYGGTAYHCGGGDEPHRIEDCLFHDNISVNAGVITTGSSNTEINLVNVTFTQNTSELMPIFEGFPSTTLRLENSIIWNNTGTLVETAWDVHADACIIEDAALTTFVSQTDIQDENPDFNVPGNNDFTLKMTSPAINAGKNVLKANNKDLDNNTRLMDGKVDLGCFEQTRPKIYHVDPTANGLNNGSTWEDAYTDLDEAFTNAIEGQQVWIAEGTYKPGLNLNPGRGVSFDLPANVPVYGGFDGTETSVDQRDYQLNQTILSGDIGTAGVLTDNSYNILVADSIGADFMVDGLVIEQSYANGGVNATQRGGAISILNAANFFIRNSYIKNNYSLNHNVFVDNVSESCEFVNCIFQANNSNDKGGAIGYESDIYAENCAFVLNTCIEGVVYQASAAAEIDLRSSTLAYNVVDVSTNSREVVASVGINGLKGKVVNSIVYGNTMNAGAKAIDNGTNTLFSVDYCVLQGAELNGFTEGINVFYQNPLFVNPATGDYSLQAGSIGLNGGDNAWVGTSAVDVIGNSRIQNEVIDMGCVESSICSKPNDHCHMAKAISPGQTLLSENNTCATPTNETAGTCGAAIGRSVWYALTITQGGTFDISLSAIEAITPNFDGKIEVFQGECGNLTLLDCVNNAAPNLSETLTLSLPGNQVYLIRISGLTAQEAYYSLSVEPSASCPGDFDNSGIIGIADLLIFNSFYGCTSNCGIVDMDGNGVVGVSDLLFFNSLYGTVCP